jgi:hypothetical protein
MGRATDSAAAAAAAAAAVGPWSVVHPPDHIWHVSVFNSGPQHAQNKQAAADLELPAMQEGLSCCQPPVE